MDWEGVANTALRWRAEAATYYTLSVAKDVLGADVPAHTIDLLNRGVGLWDQRRLAYFSGRLLDRGHDVEYALVSYRRSYLVRIACPARRCGSLV